MNASANVISNVKSDLDSIIKKLRETENGIRWDFVGIGQESCVKCIEKVIDEFQTILNGLKYS
jgi:uncharacterized cupin superfamily protein